MQKHILVVDDDDLMRRSVAFNLEQAGYLTNSAATAEDALEISTRIVPDLVLLDIGLPGMDGLDALRIFREKINAPVIFVTARRRELDEILGLEMGADDYITKPFEMGLLLAHIKAVLRRSGEPVSAAQQMEIITVGDITLDPGAHTVKVAGKEIEMTHRLFDLLHTLVYHVGQVISTRDLLASVWGAEFIGQPQVVYVHIRWLREKIETKPDKPERILTVRGVGYKLVPKES
ncbi:MAG: DNA-binding response regulator [Anaerolineaceae bacterium]|nr:DNA-binding response regulator [Anaerolineaceae bacterium]